MVAAVDVKLRLESLSAEETERGYWLNIIGYITSIAPLVTNPRSLGRSRHRVGIQCILHWSAGSVDTAKYQRHLKSELDSTDTKGRCP